MNDLLYKVRQLERSVKILDGYDNNVRSGCLKVQEYIEEIKNALLERKDLLQKNAAILQDQKLLIEKMRLFQARIDYMMTNYPKGLVHIVDENNSNVSVPCAEETRPVSPISNIHITQIDYTSPQPIANKNVMATPKPRSDMQISVSYVSNSEFQNIPQYMKGRLKVTDINSFIDLYNRTLTKKYELLKKPRNSIKMKSELDKFVTWKSQIKGDNKDLYFCTADDMFAESAVKFGKKEFSLITILRHVKRIREIRNNKLVLYVACF